MFEYPKYGSRLGHFLKARYCTVRKSISSTFLCTTIERLVVDEAGFYEHCFRIQFRVGEYGAGQCFEILSKTIETYCYQRGRFSKVSMWAVRRLSIMFGNRLVPCLNQPQGKENGVVSLQFHPATYLFQLLEREARCFVLLFLGTDLRFSTLFAICLQSAYCRSYSIQWECAVVFSSTSRNRRKALSNVPEAQWYCLCYSKSSSIGRSVAVFTQ